MADARDFDRFPAPVYRDTVLAPLFEASKRHHAGALFRIHYAHGLMLAEQKLPDSVPFELHHVHRCVAAALSYRNAKPV